MNDDQLDRPRERDGAGDEERDRVVELLRAAGPVEVEPAAHVWSRIRAEVTAPDDADTPPPIRPRRSRRTNGGRQARWPLLAAAAAGALVAWLGIQISEVDDEQDGVVVADGPLAELPDAELPESETEIDGRAEVVTVDGERRLRVQVSELPDAGEGYLEVWLVRPDVSGVVTVGVLSDDLAEFPLPAAVDLQEYPVVDISLERVDGDPTHGGSSVVRGELTQASATGLVRLDLY